MSTIRYNSDLNQVLGQIDWVQDTAKTCKPYTPSEEDRTKAWSKLRGEPRWGCHLKIVFQDSVDWMIEWDGADWEKQGLEAPADRGYLIALPGCQDDEGDSGVVWCPNVSGDKDSGGPVWVQLLVLLANPQVAWVEVVK